MTAKQKWIHGLIGGVVGGFAGAIDSGLALPILAPDKFNLDKGFGKLLLGMFVFAVLSGIKVGAAYLKRSPVPPDDDEGEKPAVPGSLVGLIVIGFLLLGLQTALIGCAQIQKGSDPLVVNVERLETTGKATFDLVLGLDNSDRGFWRTNAPAFHDFCEWLRQPQGVPVSNATAELKLELPRASAMLLGLDNVKLDYKAARASSNDLFTALMTVQSAVNQASAWSTIVTNGH